MDRADVDPHHLAGALDHVAAVNRWLGGTRALLRHLPGALARARAMRGTGSVGSSGPGAGPGAGPSPRPARVLDVGTGSGDLPLEVAEWARREGQSLEITALDLHQETLTAAADHTAAEPAIRLVRGDALLLPFGTGSFDVALLSMTLHHMDGPALERALRELGRVASGGHVLVGELERSIPGYLGARLLAATVWRGNPVTRHDGPLSVLRAFTPRELLDLARAAGLVRPRVHRHPLFRLVLLAGGPPAEEHHAG